MSCERKPIEFCVDHGQLDHYSSVRFVREKRAKLPSRKVVEIVFTPEHIDMTMGMKTFNVFVDVKVSGQVNCC